MVQDIRTTVSDALRNSGMGSYESQAQPVVRVLEAREQEIVTRLCEAGREVGASTEQVRDICRQIGMSVPVAGTTGYTAEGNVTPMPQRADGQMTAQEAAQPRSLEALVDALSERVDALARRVDAAIQRAGLRL